jgi:O6-methylguanine-DNA--protein-cysteine methyltransferase
VKSQAAPRYLTSDVDPLSWDLSRRAGRLAGASRLWDLVRQIPYGETATYGDLARWLGNGTPPRRSAWRWAATRCASWFRAIGSPARAGS